RKDNPSSRNGRRHRSLFLGDSKSTVATKDHIQAIYAPGQSGERIQTRLLQWQSVVFAGACAALPRRMHRLRVSGGIPDALISEGATLKQIPLVSYDREGSTAINIKNLLSVTHSLLTIALRRLRIVLFD